MLKSKILSRLNIKVNCSIILEEVLIVFLQFVDKVTIQGIKSHLNVWQLAHWQVLDPSKDFLELSNSSVLLLFGEIWIDVKETVHGLVPLRSGLDSLLDLWEFLDVLRDDGYALLRVLPMLSDVFGASGMLVVLELVVDVVRSFICGDESDEIWNMDLLGEVLDIQAAVNNLSIFLAILIVRLFRIFQVRDQNLKQFRL